MAILTYSPDQVGVTLAGFIVVSGFASGQFISIEKDLAPYTYHSGMDGETGRTFKRDGNYTVTITLAQSSESNNTLSALHAVDIATQLGKVPLLIRDGSGTTNFFSPNAWVENYPTVSFSKDLETRAWTLKCTEGVLLVGGNAKQNLLTDLLGLSGVAASFLGG